MKTFLKIFSRELGIIFRDHSIILTVLIAPILYAFFLGSIYLYKDANQISFAVVDMDRTQTTRQLYQFMDSAQKIKMIGTLGSYEEGVDRLYKMEINGFIYFPKGFEDDIKSLAGTDVKLYLNTTRFMPSNDLNNSVQEILLTYGAGVRLRYFEAKGMTQKTAIEMVEPLSAEVHPIFNTTNCYGNFLLPGLFLLILQQTLLIGFGESIAKENKKDRFSALFASGKNKLFGMLAGKMGFYALLYVAYFLFFFAVVFHAFEIPISGNLIAVSVMSMLFLFSVLFYTLFIASFFRSQKRYMEIMAFTSYPLFLICGYSWPISAMPLPIKWLSGLIPTTPFFNGFIKLSVMGGGWASVKGYAFHLIVLVLVSFVAVVWRWRYLEKNLNE
jgi:ABC-2 type transport system permease protein